MFPIVHFSVKDKGTEPSCGNDQQQVPGVPQEREQGTTFTLSTQ